MDSPNLTPEQAVFKERHNGWKQRQEDLVCCTLPQYHKVLKKWLYLEEKDFEFIDVGLAALNDREIPGDPVWLYLIAPPGDLKSEFLRACRAYKRGYTLDTLTAASFVSGLTEKDKDTGERIPYSGILQDLDGKTVIIKDFTTILNSSEETKTEIYGQLRSIYDGFYEKAFGTMREKVSIEAVIGLLVGVTPVIDKYTRMQSARREQLLEVLTFWFGEYDLSVTLTSEITLTIPKAETYGRVLNKLAETISKLEQGKPASRIHQTTLPIEDHR